MPSLTPVDRLYQESLSIIDAIAPSEPSLKNAASDNFRKSLVLAAASYFEHRVSTCVSDFAYECSGGSSLIVALVKNKVISRQYHTWFKWEESNANQFFGLFGSEFKQNMQERVRTSDALRDSIKAFLEVGNERNKLVHQDFASFSLEKTLEEIYALYKKGVDFVEDLGQFLREG